MSAGGKRLPSASELAEMLVDRVDDLVPTLLPAARMQGAYWTCGDVAGNPGGSMYIRRNGAKVGKWSDAAGGVDQHGDLLDLIRHAACGGDLRRAMQWASSYLGIDTTSPTSIVRPDLTAIRGVKEAQALAEDNAAIDAARAIWGRCGPIAGTLGDVYLCWRSILLPAPLSLRYHGALRHRETGTSLPAIVAAISGEDRRVTAVHRIFLALHGRGKAGVNMPKMTVGRPRNGACRLAPAGRELGISEGLETGLSAMALYGVPVWAACGPHMDLVAVPDSVERLIVFADNGGPGIRGAERAAIAHERPGREVAIVYPPAPFKDWNDVGRHDAEGVAA